MEKIFINLEGDLPVGVGVIRGTIKKETKHETEGRFLTITTEGVVNMNDIKISTLKETTESQIKASNSAEQSKQKTEFERFKQDCRKRALDLASGEYTEWNRNKNNPRASIKKDDDAPPNIIELADKFYGWLVSIPESK